MGGYQGVWADSPAYKAAYVGGFDFA